MDPTTANTAPAAAHLQRLGVAAADDLLRTVRANLNDILGRFLAAMPAHLNDAATKAAAPADRTALTELARAVPRDAAKWIETFYTQVEGHLLGGTESPVAENASGDDSIAVAGVELRAEERYAKLVTELDARFNRVRLMLYVPVYPKALAPAGLCRALQETAEAVKWPLRQRRFLLEKFDTIVVPDLERFYKSLIEAMTRIGVTAAEAAAKGEAPPPPKPRKVAPKVAQTPTSMQPPANPQVLDAESYEMLQKLALKSDGAGYTDGLLAADLIALSDEKPLPGVQQDQSWIPLQRIGLAGHFLNVVISDAMVPEELKPQHESVRFPLMKSALTDDTLFTSVSHPLGSLIHEMLLKSATSRVTGNSETRRMAELLQQVLVQFDLAPEFVRQAMKASSPIQQTQIQRFYELQRQQAQQRRDFVIAEAKRVVVRELEQATFGREIPATALRFLNQAWGPLLTKRLLTHGAASAQYKQALAQMEQMLDVVEQRIPGTAPSNEWKDLLKQLGGALVGEGMPADKARELVQGLEAARLTPLAAAAG